MTFKYAFCALAVLIFAQLPAKLCGSGLGQCKLRETLKHQLCRIVVSMQCMAAPALGKHLALRGPPGVTLISRLATFLACYADGTRCWRQVGKQLQLSPRQCLPMVVPFERFGNTSSSSTWRAPSAGSAEGLGIRGSKP